MSGFYINEHELNEEEKTLNRLVIETLRPTNTPVAYMKYNQPHDTYIVFLFYNIAPRLTADDEELITKHFIQMDVFSKFNFLKLNKQIKKLMKEAGFGRMFESETYDEDMGMYRKIFRFNFENNIGEEY